MSRRAQRLLGYTAAPIYVARYHRSSATTAGSSSPTTAGADAARASADTTAGARYLMSTLKHPPATVDQAEYYYLRKQIKSIKTIVVWTAACGATVRFGFGFSFLLAGGFVYNNCVEWRDSSAEWVKEQGKVFMAENFTILGQPIFRQKTIAQQSKAKEEEGFVSRYTGYGWLKSFSKKQDEA